MDLSDINFGDLSQKANEMANADSVQATPEPAKVETPVVASPATSVVTPDPSLATQTPATPGQVSPAEQKISVDFGNGKVEQLTTAEIAAKLQEAERSGLRQSDYTKKTTEIAQLRAEALKVHQQLQQQAQEFERERQLLNNPQAMLAEAQRRVAESQPIDPNQPMTISQGLQMVQAIKQEFENIKKVNEDEARGIVEDRLQVANYVETINGKLSKVYETHPVLKSLPELEAVMRYRVAAMNPQTMEETLQAFESVAKDMASPFETAIKAKQVESEAARAKLTTQGIEPPGGVAPQMTKPDFRAKDGRDLDWDKLKEAARGL